MKKKLFAAIAVVLLFSLSATAFATPSDRPRIPLTLYESKAGYFKTVQSSYPQDYYSAYCPFF